MLFQTVSHWSRSLFKYEVPKQAKYSALTCDEQTGMICWNI